MSVKQKWILQTGYQLIDYPVGIEESELWQFAVTTADAPKIESVVVKADSGCKYREIETISIFAGGKEFMFWNWTDGGPEPTITYPLWLLGIGYSPESAIEDTARRSRNEKLGY